LRHRAAWLQGTSDQAGKLNLVVCKSQPGHSLSMS